MCRVADGSPSCSCRARRSRKPPPSHARARARRRRNTFAGRPRVPSSRPARALVRQAHHGSPVPTHSARCARIPAGDPRAHRGSNSWLELQPTTLREEACADRTSLPPCASSNPSSRDDRSAATTRAPRRAARCRRGPRGRGRNRGGGPRRKAFLSPSPRPACGQGFSQTRPSRARSLSAASGPQLPAS